jgi:predicted lysophospholipase L1 biosynthesis ABC-type transport system permease subunit
VVTHTYDPVGSPVPLVLTDGTPPTSPDDVVLAPTTADQLHVTIGSTVALRGDVGETTMKVTGIGFAVESSTSGYDHGAWVPPAAYDRLFTGFKEHTGLIALRPGVEPATALARLEKVAGDAAGGQNTLIITPFVPQQIAEINALRNLPVVLGMFLAVLAVGATAHALTAGVRRRHGDLAVLRALGTTRWQCRVVVLTQVTVIAVIGLMFGIPLGLALGRALWHVTASYTPLSYQAPFASSALLLVAPVTLLIAALLAVWPGHRITRLPIGQALRTE